jgi:thioredoxin 1
MAIGWLATVAAAQQPASAPATATNPAPAKTVGQTYPRLTSGALAAARLGLLADGAVLKAGDLTVKATDLADQVGKAPEAVREQLKKNAFFVLEQMATGKLLLAEAQATLAKDGKDVSKLADRELLDGLFAKLTADLKVTDQEVSDFYSKNKDVVGDQPLESVKDAIGKHLLQQKQQEIVSRHVATLGQRTTIEVSAAWAKQQEADARDNPVDKARDSGKPSLVDFGAKGCIPCDKLAPILEAMKTKYDGKANVLFISVREQQILASRYGIQSIPVQVFFDKDGKEVFRHTGFWPQEDLEKKLAELGAK